MPDSVDVARAVIILLIVTIPLILTAVVLYLVNTSLTALKNVSPVSLETVFIVKDFASGVINTVLLSLVALAMLFASEEALSKK